MDQQPPLSTVFLNSAGFPNTQTIDGHYTISPRFGFNWDVSKDQTTQIHGGAGLFRDHASVRVAGEFVQQRGPHDIGVREQQLQDHPGLHV